MKLKKIIILILLIGGFQNLLSENISKNDSLKQLLKRYETIGKEDKKTIEILKQLYKENYYSNPEIAIEYIDKAEKIYIKKGDKKGVGDCYNLKGKLYFEQGLYSLAMDYYYKCYEIMRELKENGALAYSLNDIGNTYFAQKIYDLPQEFYKKAAKIFQKNEDRFGLSVSYNNIALVKRNTHQYDSALYYLSKSLEIRKALNNFFLVAHTYYYIGKIYRLKKEYEKAKQYHNRSLEILKSEKEQTAEVRNLEADTYFETGMTLSDERRTEESRKNFLRAYVIYETIKNSRMMSKTALEIGKLYSKNGNIEKASEYIRKSLIIGRKNNYRAEERECYYELYELSLRIDKKDEAIKYLRKYSDMSDSISSDELKDKLDEVRVAIKTYSKEKENEFLRQETRNVKRMSLAIILFLSCIILFAVYYINNKSKNEKRWKQLSNVTFEGVLVHDNNKIIDCNNRFLQQTGYTRKEIENITVMDLIKDEERESVRRLMEEEKISDYELKIQKKDGTYFYGEIFARHTNFRGKDVRVAAIRDITQRKEMELKLKKKTEELKALNTTKDKFFSIIAHDLRNPFSGIIGITEHLKTSIEEGDYSNVKELTELINESAKQASYLLENLLEWSRAQTGKLKYEPEIISLNQIATEESELHRNIAYKKGIGISIQQAKEIFAYADRNLVKTVIRNLISNAIKFTEKGEVIIDIQERAEQVELCVNDTGIGIREQDKDKLFRIDISPTSIGTKGEKGTGLGLILCKEFVEKNGGQIWFKSDYGKGSSFCFSLPKGQG